MPTLSRFLVTLAILAGIGYAAMFVLANFVQPREGELTVRVPLDKLDQQP
jgi:hypothetical protein